MPFAHAMHDEEPGIALYVPAGHAAQEMPSGPVRPTWHLQADDTALWAGALEFAGHGSHALFALLLYVSAGHSMHVSSEVANHSAEALPGGHWVQGAAHRSAH